MKLALRRLAASVRLLSLVSALLLGGCDPSPPAPPEVLAQVKAFVEDGERASAPAPIARADIFSMPGGITSRQETRASAPPAAKTIVTRAEESAASQKIADLKPGTAARFYEVWANRTGADGIERSIYRTFYLWEDGAGTWHWMRNPRPSSLEDDR